MSRGIAFTDRQTGLRDYRVHVARDRARWPWLLLVVILGALLFGIREASL